MLDWDEMPNEACTLKAEWMLNLPYGSNDDYKDSGDGWNLLNALKHL